MTPSSITLSPAQHAEITRRQIPNVTTQVVSYLDYKPPVKFDSIISIWASETCSAPRPAKMIAS